RSGTGRDGNPILGVCPRIARPMTATHSIVKLDLEEALRRERSLLRTVIDSIPALIYAKDLESRFIACNVLAARGMGTTPDQAIGKTDFDFFPREMAAGFFRDEQAVIHLGIPLIEREESVLDRATGHTRYFCTTKVP